MKGFALENELERLKQQGLYRSRRVIDSPQDVSIRIDGRPVLNFCSNDYLGLARHPQVISAFQQAANHYGIGSGSAHLICGHSVAHHTLEEELATFTKRDRALLFSTGYMANLGVLSALLGRGDDVFEDKLNHASLLDGGLFSGATFKRYLHADVDSLQKKLNRSTAAKKILVTDGVFSMDGDLAPLVDLASLAKKNEAALMVDDAHGLGVLGQTGGGLVEQCELTQTDVPILMGTFGKAFGTSGAFVAGSEALIETLIQKSRPYIYTTALPAAIAAATSTSLNLLINDSWRREKLQALIMQFKQGANQLGLRLMNSNSAIQPILVGDAQKAVAISQHLLDLGILVTAIRPPTVAKGQARLRVTFSANHQKKNVTSLLNALEKSIL
ncbi:MAG: 8-amino-7-oxononanoate synthase [Methylococcales bacterium]|nr:8-amino-7-oxononanoate synthase [Methylococcales bacterium]